MEFQYVLLILVVVYLSSQSEPPTSLLRVAIRIQRFGHKEQSSYHLLVFSSVLYELRYLHHFV